RAADGPGVPAARVHDAQPRPHDLAAAAAVRRLGLLAPAEHQRRRRVDAAAAAEDRPRTGRDRPQRRLPAGRMIIHRAIAWFAIGRRAESLLATFCALCLIGMV